jgi:hypothetical protein
MKTLTRKILAGLLSIGVGQAAGAASAYAQGPGSLGGYGGSMMATNSGMGMSGPAIPYGGRFAGFMPYRMNGSGSLSFQSRGESAMGGRRTSFSLSPMPGGMSSTSGGMGRGLGVDSGLFSPSGLQGVMGRGVGMPSMSGTRGMGVMPPSFGYPFRQPPNLLTPSSGTGMSM